MLIGSPPPPNMPLPVVFLPGPGPGRSPQELTLGLAGILLLDSDSGGHGAHLCGWRAPQPEPWFVFRSGVRAVRAQAQGSLRIIVQPMNPR